MKIKQLWLGVLIVTSGLVYADDSTKVDEVPQEITKKCPINIVKNSTEYKLIKSTIWRAAYPNHGRLNCCYSGGLLIYYSSIQSINHAGPGWVGSPVHNCAEVKGKPDRCKFNKVTPVEYATEGKC